MESLRKENEKFREEMREDRRELRTLTEEFWKESSRRFEN